MSEKIQVAATSAVMGGTLALLKLAIGFLTSMRKEWAWRVSRGESTRNLDAFRHLLEDQTPP